MELMDYIKKLIRNYFTIFSLIVICVTVSSQILLPNKSLELKDIYIYMICSLIIDLLSLILYSTEKLSEKQMWIRRVIHFIILNGVLLIFTNVIGFIYDTLDIIILEIQIIVIYAIFQFLVWMYDKKDANEINEKLNIMREELEIKNEEE